MKEADRVTKRRNNVKSSSRARKGTVSAKSAAIRRIRYGKPVRVKAKNRAELVGSSKERKQNSVRAGRANNRRQQPAVWLNLRDKTEKGILIVDRKQASGRKRTLNVNKLGAGGWVPPLVRRNPGLHYDWFGNVGQLVDGLGRGAGMMGRAIGGNGRDWPNGRSLRGLGRDIGDIGRMLNRLGKPGELGRMAGSIGKGVSALGRALGADGWFAKINKVIEDAAKKQGATSSGVHQSNGKRGSDDGPYKRDKGQVVRG